MGLRKPIRIPGISLEGNIFLAPVAGYTDRAFREICRSFGADLSFTELISAEGIRRNNRKSTILLEHGPDEGPVAIQIFGSDPGSIADAVPSILEHAPALIDINCGCPVPKVTKTGAGSALMKDPELIGRIVRALKKRVADCGSAVPVSVKIRSGWDAASITYREAAAAAVEGGAAIVTLHPRTRVQGYGGKANWGHIADLKRLIPVPVIGSGDLHSAGDARRMLTETGCDGVMFARGAFGNPFIFRETNALLADGETIAPPGVAERLDIAMRHLDLSIRYMGETAACKEMRKHFCAYTRGLSGSAHLRDRIVHASTLHEYREAVGEFLG